MNLIYVVIDTLSIECRAMEFKIILRIQNSFAIENYPNSNLIISYLIKFAGRSPHCADSRSFLSGTSDRYRRKPNHCRKFLIRRHYCRISSTYRKRNRADRNHIRRDIWNLLSDCSLIVKKPKKKRKKN